MLEKASQKQDVYGMKLNVASDENWATLAKEVNDRFAKIDILVYDAGISFEKPYDQNNIDDWQKNVFPLMALAHSLE